MKLQDIIEKLDKEDQQHLAKGLRFIAWHSVKNINFHFDKNSKRLFDTLATFKYWRSGQTLDSKSFDQMWQDIRTFDSMFGIDRHILRRIFGKKHNCDYANCLQQLIDKNLIKKFNHGKIDWHDKEGVAKTLRFSCRYVLSQELLDDIFKDKDNLDKVLKFKDGLYDKKTIKLISRVFNNKKENDMTKQEKIDWQKKYERGETCMTVEQKEKFDAKQKRQLDKRRMTIAKKAAKATLTEYTKMQMEIEQLKKEIEYLKKLKDLNSDIPEEEDEAVEVKEEVKQEPVKQDNSDIDESDVTCCPLNNSQKVIAAAIERLVNDNDVQQKLKNTVFQNKLIPINDSMRFYYLGNKRILDTKTQQVHTLDSTKQFKVNGCYYDMYAEKYNNNKEMFDDKYYYANRYLHWLKENSGFDVMKTMQHKLTQTLGFKPEPAFK